MNLTVLMPENKNTLQFKIIIAEFIGTFLLASIGIAGSIIQISSDAFFNQLTLCLCIGSMVFLFTFFFYKVSGAHFNPAISIGFYIANRISFNKLLLYISIHLLSGIIAAVFVLYVFSDKKIVSFDIESSSIFNNSGALLLSLVCQSVMMFIVMLLFLVLTYIRKSNFYIACFMSIAILIACFINISITDYPLNPAITAGEFLLLRNYNITEALALWLSPFAGAIMAGIIYFITFVKPVS